MYPFPVPTRNVTNTSLVSWNKYSHCVVDSNEIFKKFRSPFVYPRIILYCLETTYLRLLCQRLQMFQLHRSNENILWEDFCDLISRPNKQIQANSVKLCISKHIKILVGVRRITQSHGRSICCDDFKISRYDYRDYDIIIIVFRMADGCEADGVELWTNKINSLNVQFFFFLNKISPSPAVVNIISWCEMTFSFKT